MAARGANVPLTEAAARLVETDELRPAARRSLRTFLNDLERWRTLAGQRIWTSMTGRRAVKLTQSPISQDGFERAVIPTAAT